MVQEWYTTATDIDDRKRAERQQQFLSELSLSLSLLNDPAPMQQTVVARLGAYLDASGCCFNVSDLATNQATLLTTWSQAQEPFFAVAIPRADEAKPGALTDVHAGICGLWRTGLGINMQSEKPLIDEIISLVSLTLSSDDVFEVIFEGDIETLEQGVAALRAFAQTK